MAEQNAQDLTKWEARILSALVALWVLSKVYRITLMERYGLFSWELWRADLSILGVLVIIGAAGFRIAHQFERRSESVDKAKQHGPKS